LRVGKLEPNRAAGPCRAQPLLTGWERQVRAKSPGFDHVSEDAAKIFRDQVIRVDQVPRDLALDIDPNTAGPKRPAALDFSPNTDPDDVMVGMTSEHPAGMTAW